jgi:hypothetical protein
MNNIANLTRRGTNIINILNLASITRININSRPTTTLHNSRILLNSTPNILNTGMAPTLGGQCNSYSAPLAVVTLLYAGDTTCEGK